MEPKIILWPHSFFSDLIKKMYLIKKNYLTLIWKNLKPYWHHYFPFWSGQTLGWDAKDRWLERYWSSEVEWLVHITSRSNPNIQTIFQQFVKLQEDRLHSSIAARWKAGSWSADCPSTDQSCQSDWMDSRDKMTWIFDYQLILRHNGRRTYRYTIQLH